jgi:hypothetical protein
VEGVRSGHCFSDEDAEPNRCQSKEEASEGVERGHEGGPATQAGEDLPLIGRKGAVSTDETDGDEKSPGGVSGGATAQVGDREADDDTGAYVDDEGAIGKPGAPSGGDRGTDPISRDGAERATQRDVEVLLQCGAPVQQALDTRCGVSHPLFITAGIQGGGYPLSPYF